MQVRACLLFGLLQLCTTIAYQETHQSVLEAPPRPGGSGGGVGPKNIEKNPNKRGKRKPHYPNLLEVHLTSSAQNYAANEPVVVTVELFNPGPRKVHFLSYFLPSENDLNDRLFDVTLNGESVEYIGPVLKRKTPSDTEYIKLKKGDSVRGSLDLAQYFDFSVGGEYTITYDVASWQMFNESGPASGDVEGVASAPVVVTVAGRAAPARALPSLEAATKVKTNAGYSWTNACSANQQNQIINGVNQAWSYVGGGNIPIGNTNRFLTWFKEYNSAYHTIIQTHFSNIGAAMNSAVFDCNCGKPNVYAYVYPNQPYRIYLCGSYWSAPVAGTDSKGGTIIHELSHFDIVGDTEDYAYGHQNCKALSAGYARFNADSHEYYAENT